MKFEYKIESMHGFGLREKTEELNNWGNAGWEVCGLLSANQYETNFIFKRAIPGEPDLKWKSSYTAFSDNMKAARKRQDEEKLNEGLTIHPIHPGENCYCNDCYSSRVVSGKEEKCS